MIALVAGGRARGPAFTARSGDADLESFLGTGYLVQSSELGQQLRESLNPKGKTRM
jgi:hypothetical protein